jgi:uncharacterized membrane protein YeaQ/YmgE (transglycosylase-associated protein family)
MIWTIIIGLIAGLIAGKIMKENSQGCLVTLLIGILGGVVGGWVFNLLNIQGNGTVGQIVTSTVGAVIILWIWARIRK